MSIKIQIDPATIEAIRDQLLTLVGTLNDILAGVGCTHANKEETSTMGNPAMRKFYCHDCDQFIEEEWENVEDY
jgi:hypothetical protein